MNDPLIEAIHEHEPMDGLEEVNRQLAKAVTDIAGLRAELRRLDRDLDESRRLNRRAAELLDLVYEHLASSPGGAPEREGFAGDGAVTGPHIGSAADAKVSVLEGKGAGI